MDLYCRPHTILFFLGQLEGDVLVQLHKLFSSIDMHVDGSVLLGRGRELYRPILTST